MEDPMKSDMERIEELEEKVELLGNWAVAAINKIEGLEEAYRDVSLLAVKLTERVAALYSEVLRLKGEDEKADDIDKITESFIENNERILEDDPRVPQRPDFGDLEKRPDWFK